MALALYAPGLGYYASGSRKFGLMPSVGAAPRRSATDDADANDASHAKRANDASNAKVAKDVNDVPDTDTDTGSDFATAPEISPHFGRALARQVAQALEATGTHEVWEFGAGSGALAQQLLEALGPQVERYTIVDLSGSLRARQAARLAGYGGQVQCVSSLPEHFSGVVVGNEVLDAMPVKLLARLGGVWHERGVEMAPTPPASFGSLPPEGAHFSSGRPFGKTLAPTPPNAPPNAPTLTFA
ncbi:MAG: SAM-dependent methyltransferase, partial [Polaromonas sp.]|nr:SAM-dependent methyltransferase [Polaromonas sp.]